MPNFYEILRFCTRLQVDFKFLLWLISEYKQISYKHFPAVVAFLLKFSIVPSCETIDRINKVRQCKNGTDLLYHHAKYAKDRGSRAGCRRKSVMFFCSFFVFFVTLWNHEVCDNGNAMKQCTVIFKTIMVPLHTGRFLVVHLYSTFSMDPLDFFLGANLHEKMLFFCDFGGRKATFLKPRR